MHIAAMTLKEWKALSGKTHSEIADLIGRNRSTITRVLRGDTLPDWETMLAILDVTNGAVTPNDFSPLRVGAPAAAE